MPTPKKKILSKLRSYQKPQVKLPAIMGDFSDNLYVTGRTDYVYVRTADREVTEVFNSRVIPRLNLPVYIGYDPKEPYLLQVLSIRQQSSQTIKTTTNTSQALLPHGNTHSWLHPDGGSDTVYVQLRQFMPLRVTPVGGMNIRIERGISWLNDKWQYLSGTTLDLTPYAPETGAVFALIYEDMEGVPSLATGTVKDGWTLTPQDIPDYIPGTIPLAAVRLWGGQTMIGEARNTTDIVDLRFPAPVLGNPEDNKRLIWLGW